MRTRMRACMLEAPLFCAHARLPCWTPRRQGRRPSNLARSSACLGGVVDDSKPMSRMGIGDHNGAVRVQQPVAKMHAEYQRHCRSSATLLLLESIRVDQVWIKGLQMRSLCVLRIGHRLCLQREGFQNVDWQLRRAESGGVRVGDATTRTAQVALTRVSPALASFRRLVVADQKCTIRRAIFCTLNPG